MEQFVFQEAVKIQGREYQEIIRIFPEGLMIFKLRLEKGDEE
jgi:hypothetical protein